jgi:WhiB family transcriptional regulator, redox-sensing transcriptional regulator
VTRARMPRPHEVAAARRDPRLLRALQERDEDLTWRARGVCQSVDPEVFFPAPSEPADAAVALCRTCEVQGACLAWALEVGDCHGVWGATTPRERRAMLVAWRSDDANQMLPVSPAAAVPVVPPSPTAPAVPVPVSAGPATVLLGIPAPRGSVPVVRMPRTLSPAVGERLATPA